MDHKQKLVQFMLARGCVEYDEFVGFLEGLRNSNSQSQLSEEVVCGAVSNLNRRLTKYNMMIRAASDDVTHKKYYCLISTADNPITKQASHHTAKEYDYFRLVWQAITQKNDNLDVIKELAKKNKVNNCDQLLQEWHNNHWFVIDGDSIRLGVRSKAELDVLQLQDQSDSMNADTSH